MSTTPAAPSPLEFAAMDFSSIPFELLVWSVSIADECETSVIECACEEILEQDGHRWFDLGKVHSTKLEEVAWAADYLRRRHLLIDHPTQPGLARLRYLGSWSHTHLNTVRDGIKV